MEAGGVSAKRVNKATFNATESTGAFCEHCLSPIFAKQKRSSCAAAGDFDCVVADSRVLPPPASN